MAHTQKVRTTEEIVDAIRRATDTIMAEQFIAENAIFIEEHRTRKDFNETYMVEQTVWVFGEYGIIASTHDNGQTEVAIIKNWSKTGKTNFVETTAFGKNRRWCNANDIAEAMKMILDFNKDTK